MLFVSWLQRCHIINHQESLTPFPVFTWQLARLSSVRPAILIETWWTHLNGAFHPQLTSPHSNQSSPSIAVQFGNYLYSLIKVLLLGNGSMFCFQLRKIDTFWWRNIFVEFRFSIFDLQFTVLNGANRVLSCTKDFIRIESGGNCMYWTRDRQKNTKIYRKDISDR